MTKKRRKLSEKDKERKKAKAGLSKRYNAIKNRDSEFECDYLDKLTEEEKKWLHKFNEEYINANFKHGSKVLHNTKKLKKTVYDKNNARNRCLLNQYKDTYDELEGSKLKGKI